MTREYNVLMIYDARMKNVLMCRRGKPPYAGLLNFAGGKIEPGEDGLAAAYREMEEETGLTRADLSLSHLMDFTYYPSDCLLEVYAGRLRREARPAGEENELLWVSLREDFFDTRRFAGAGNIGHMIAEAEHHKEAIFL